MGKGIIQYSNANRGVFPRTRFVNGAPIQIGNDGFADPNPFTAPNSPGRTNNVPAALFLLVRGGYLPAANLICPTDRAAGVDAIAQSSPATRSNFAGNGLPSGSVRLNLSYSFVNVYPTTTAIGLGYKIYITAFTSDFAIAADLSPTSMSDPRWKSCVSGAPRFTITPGNSRNHSAQGQNVLYADGHAEYQQTPLCGSNGDNIYTAQDTSAGTNCDRSIASDDPQTPTDSILLMHGP
jgi:prepilin-type processing-associated H-X9-DG protein